MENKTHQEMNDEAMTGQPGEGNEDRTDLEKRREALRNTRSRLSGGKSEAGNDPRPPDRPREHESVPIESAIVDLTKPRQG